MVNRSKFTPERFLKELAEGRRQFGAIEFTPTRDFTRTPYFIIAQEKLRESPSRDPIVVNGSDFCDVYAPDLYLSHLSARGAEFDGSEFPSAYFAYGNFEKAKFRRDPVLREATSVHTIFKDAIFQEGDLRHADIAHANFDGAQFYGTDLRGVRNVEKSRLSGAGFFNVKLSPHQIEIFRRFSPSLTYSLL